MCMVPGCDCTYSENYKPKKKYSRTQQVCFKHWIATKSGRVGPNWRQRDRHNFHRKGYCECCGKTAYQFGLEILKWKGANISDYRVRDIVRIGMRCLQGDHI